MNIKLNQLITPISLRLSIGSGLICFWVSTIKKPETLFIHGVLEQFKYALWAGLSWQMISLVISVIQEHPSDRRITGQIQFDRLFSYIVAFTGVFWLTANYGDRVYAIYRDQPFILATDVVCLFIVWLGLFISHYFRPSNNANGSLGSFDAGTVAAGMRPPLSKRDKRFVSVHESGHALTYAALNSLPKHVEVRLLPESHHGTLGYVSGVICENRLMTDDFCEWLMICLVAGKEAELVTFGRTNISGYTDSSDLVRWHDLATHYLSNQQGGLFFVKPADALEQDHNVKMLITLRQKHQTMARNIIEQNRLLLEQMVKQLENKGDVKNKELSQLLSQVKIPNDFPRPELTNEEIALCEQN